MTGIPKCRTLSGGIPDRYPERKKSFGQGLRETNPARKRVGDGDRPETVGRAHEARTLYGQAQEERPNQNVLPW